MATPKTPQVKLVLVDDHSLFRKGLTSLIEMIRNEYRILFEADNKTSQSFYYSNNR